MSNRRSCVSCLACVVVLLLVLKQCVALSTFHQDVAFSFIDTQGPTVFPDNDFDHPPLLDRRGENADFTAPVAGLYAFVFHVGTWEPIATPTDPTDYQLVKIPSLPAVATQQREVLVRLTTHGPGFGHALVDLDLGDLVQLETYNGTDTATWISPDANDTNPVVFNCFSVYHRCLCSPLIIRQSAFSASSIVSQPDGNNLDVSPFRATVNLQGAFDESTGVFTAIVPGIYVFMYSFPNEDTMLSVSLVLNEDQVLATVTSQNDSNRILQYAGTTTVVDLLAGDRVKLVKSGGAISFPTVTLIDGTTTSASPILFSGFLL